MTVTRNTTPPTKLKKSSEYKVRWHEKTLKDLKDMDRAAAQAIISKIKSYIVKSPLELGKPLSRNFKGMYRYRSGDYRVVYTIDLENREITILRVGHRKEIYK